MNTTTGPIHSRHIMLTIFLCAPALSGIYFSILGQNLNFERASFIALTLPLIYFVTIRTATKPTQGWSRSILVLALWNLSLLLSSFFSDSTSSHTQGFVICAIPTIIGIYIASHPNVESIFDKTSYRVFIFLTIGGVISYFVAPFLPSSISQMIVGNASNESSVKFTTVEPNIFGSTLGFFLLVTLHQLKTKRFGFVLLMLAFLAIFLSFSRGPYAALIFGLLIYAIFSGLFQRPNKIILIFSGGFLAFLSAFILWEFIYPSIEATINRQGTIKTRSVINSYAIERFWQSPLVGNGPLDFPHSMGFITKIVGASSPNQISISQMFIGILHDSGIVGLILYVLFLLSILWHGARQCRRGDAPRRASYLAGFISLVLASQTTAIYYTAIFGVAAGILASKSQHGNVSTLSRRFSGRRA